MPLLGWISGISFASWIKAFDHWIACTILVFLGLKMILESGTGTKQLLSNPMEIPILFMMALATSIDALAVGVTLSFLEISILAPIIVLAPSHSFSLSAVLTLAIVVVLLNKIEIAGVMWHWFQDTHPTSFFLLKYPATFFCFATNKYLYTKTHH